MELIELVRKWGVGKMGDYCEWGLWGVSGLIWARGKWIRGIIGGLAVIVGGGLGRLRSGFGVSV